MLEEISIANLGVIKEAKLEFTDGLNIITGETGAGKTMVLTGLHLLLGRRADSSIVSDSADATTVEGVWRVSKEEVLAKVEEAGALLDEGLLFTGRTVKKAGSSRAFLGGRNVPAGILQEIGGSLVNIHGQSDQLRLKNNDAQLEALDRSSASVRKLLGDYGTHYSEWRKIRNELKDLESNFELRRFEFDKLAEVQSALDSLDPYIGERAELERTIERLSHMEEIAESFKEAGALLSQDSGFSPEDSLRQSLKLLRNVSGYSPEISDLVDLGKAAADAVESFIGELENQAELLDEQSMEELYAAQDRLMELKTFEKKYRKGIDELLEEAPTRSARMKELDPETHSVEALTTELTESEKLLDKSAKKLTKARKVAAEELVNGVNKELDGLAMGGVSFAINFDGTSFAKTGSDTIHFVLGRGDSASFKPIASAASGGELSRVMLALEVVLADPDSTPTFVFDEVDSGIGGATAIEVGKRLARLAKEAQVIVVTHLPQVAVWADSHLLVIKDTSSGTAITTVSRLNDEERVQEIARMLSGLGDSSSGQAHARELIALANGTNNE